MTQLPGMPYAAVYASLPWHEKVCAMPERDRLAAFGLYVAALVYCQTNRTDGRITTPQLAAAFHCAEADRKNLTDTLVKVRLFDAVPGGIQVHDYLDYNLSRAQIEDAKHRMREGGSKGGKAGKGKPKSPPSKPTLPTVESPPLKGHREEQSRAVSEEESGEEQSGADRPSCSWCNDKPYMIDGQLGVCPECGVVR